MAEKILGLFCFILVLTAVTCFHFDQDSFDLVRHNFRDASSGKRWENLNQLNPYSFFRQNDFKYHIPDFYEPMKYNSGLKRVDHPKDFRQLHKIKFQDLSPRSRNYIEQFTALPLRKLFKPSFDKRSIKDTFNFFDKNIINLANSDSDNEAITDLNNSAKETMKVEDASITHPGLSSDTPIKFSISTDDEMFSSTSSKPTMAVTSSIDANSPDTHDNFNKKLGTDSNLQSTERDFVSKFVSSLNTKLTSEGDKKSEYPEDETSTKENQVKDNEKDFTTNSVLPSSENNQASTTHSVFSSDTSNGFVTNHVSSNPEKESFLTDTTDSSVLFTTDFVKDNSKSFSLSSTTEISNAIKTSEQSLNLDISTNANVRSNSYPSPLIDDTKISLDETQSSVSTVETKVSTTSYTETSFSSENAHTGSDTSYESSTNYLNPSSTVDKESTLKYLKSTTAHEVTDYSAKYTSDPVKNKNIHDITDGIRVSADPTTPRDNFVRETIVQDHVITNSTIRTVRIAISVTFLAIALIAVAILSIYLLRIRRNSVEYDQLLLLS